MRKNIQRIICLALVFVSCISVFTGCSGTGDIPTLVPDTQIMEDKYELNPKISNEMTYVIDYITDPPSSYSLNTNIDSMTVFNHMELQVDEWEVFTIGKSTLGDVEQIIKNANVKYVTDNTNAVIAKRQAEIDAEYEEAKAKAEAKGKTYDKPKKEVRTDDIHFDEPYSYTISLMTTNTSKLPPAEEYKPTFLVDPTVNPEMYFDVAKYGIPYVRITCKAVTNVYNTGIAQESDWVITKVQAADISALMNEDGSTKDYIDADGLNKAAKQNIVMSGNINFSGQGFTWDSLRILCNALGLTINQNSWSSTNNNSFQQSSDDKFTYYTISLYANPYQWDNRFEGEKHETVIETTDFNGNITTTTVEGILTDGVYIPVIQLVATFDKLTQVCLNWTIDMSTAPRQLSSKIHNMSDDINVNVHEYQVDTNDYAGMRETIQNWIDSNSKTWYANYVVIGDNKKKPIEGTVTSGITNIEHEIEVDGVMYVCISCENRGQGIWFGTFMSQEDNVQIDNFETEEERQKFINSKKKEWTIKQCIVDADKNMISDEYNSTTLDVHWDEMKYYIADTKTDAVGNVTLKAIPEDTVNTFMVLMSKTYKLNEVETKTIRDLFDKGGILAVRNYVYNLFKDAEAAQKEQNEDIHNQETKPSDSNKNEQTTNTEPTEPEATTSPESTETDVTTPEENTSVETEPDAEG